MEKGEKEGSKVQHTQKRGKSKVSIDQGCCGRKKDDYHKVGWVEKERMTK